MESKCSCPYKEGETCTNDNGGGGKGGNFRIEVENSYDGGGETTSSMQYRGGGNSFWVKMEDKIGVMGIILICV